MKKEFFDEQILALRNQEEGGRKRPVLPGEDMGDGGSPDASQIPPEERSIYTGIRIEGAWIYFERRFLQEEVISIMVPKNFTPMKPGSCQIQIPFRAPPTDHPDRFQRGSQPAVPADGWNCTGWN
uniref:hypothetical protein n=1 Tax=Enterocloster clostridioformis TaxID=1531 RepID=UPI0025A5E76A|nr:hypothetical protein [Enterocloster clostridioformis]